MNMPALKEQLARAKEREAKALLDGSNQFTAQPFGEGLKGMINDNVHNNNTIINITEYNDMKENGEIALPTVPPVTLPPALDFNQLNNPATTPAPKIALSAGTPATDPTDPTRLPVTSPLGGPDAPTRPTHPTRPPIPPPVRTREMRKRLLAWLDAVGGVLRQRELTGIWLRAADIAGLILDQQEIGLPGNQEDRELDDPRVWKDILIACGRRLSQCFGGQDLLELRNVTVEREVKTDKRYGQVRILRRYRFQPSAAAPRLPAEKK
jgi:hypothetical protein